MCKSSQYLSNLLQGLKGVLKPNFINLTINSENFGSRNVLVPFLNLLLLKSCKSTLPLTSIPKVLLGSRVLLSFKNHICRLWGCWCSHNDVIKLLKKINLNIFSFRSHRTLKPRSKFISKNLIFSQFKTKWSKIKV